jgi:hypothetical protein
MAQPSKDIHVSSTQSEAPFLNAGTKEQSSAFDDREYKVSVI